VKYIVHGTVTVFVSFEVEADNEADALEISGTEISGLNVYADGNTVGVDHEDAELHGDYFIDWTSAELCD